MKAKHSTPVHLLIYAKIVIPNLKISCCKRKVLKRICTAKLNTVPIFLEEVKPGMHEKLCDGCFLMCLVTFGGRIQISEFPQPGAAKEEISAWLPAITINCFQNEVNTVAFQVRQQKMCSISTSKHISWFKLNFAWKMLSSRARKTCFHYWWRTLPLLYPLLGFW